MQDRRVVAGGGRAAHERMFAYRRRLGQGLTGAASGQILNHMVQQSPTLDRAFAALADPKRRHILERLGTGPVATSDLAAPLDMTVTGVLKHVRLLEDARLLSTQKVGRVRWCRLAPASSFDEAASWIDARRRTLEGRLERFEAHIARLEGQQP